MICMTNTPNTMAYQLRQDFNIGGLSLSVRILLPIWPYSLS